MATTRLTAFADESGHSQDAHCTHIGIAAILLTSEGSKCLSARWSELLSAADVPHFHMKEFAHSVGPFKGWTEKRRRELLGPLLDAIVEAGPSIFGAVMPLSEWRALAPDQQALFIDPWFPCLQECAYLSAAHGSTVGQAIVDFTFSRQDDFQGRAANLWPIMTERSSPFDSLGTFKFEDMRNEPCLQAADLATYEIVLAHKQVGAGAVDIRFPLNRLRECDHHFRYINGAYIRTQVEGATS